MFFNMTRFFWVLTSMVFVTLSTTAMAQTLAEPLLANGGSLNATREVFFKAKPQQCVVLNEGQVCHKTIRLFWRVSEQGDYCLYITKNRVELQCWRNAAVGEYQLAFDSDVSLPIVLVDIKNKETLATLNISVSWVYEARRESRATWRLF